MNRRGSILLEGVAGLVILLFSLFVLIELIRLAEMHISMEQAVFIYVRERAFGRTAVEAERKGRRFLDRFWGNAFQFPVKFRESYKEDAWIGRVHVRYPQFLSFRLGKEFKHHLEVTKSCRFPG